MTINIQVTYSDGGTSFDFNLGTGSMILFIIIIISSKLIKCNCLIVLDLWLNGLTMFAIHCGVGRERSVSNRDSVG